LLIDNCSLLTLPNAKLNLGLRVTARRPDGYHDLETAFVPLPWTDVLDVLPAPAGQLTTLTLSGRPVPGEPASNLCLKAYELLRADHPALPPAQLHLHKVVPIGAGLGGGSADAAFALRAFNQVFELGLNSAQLEAYARRLGADCAFFIENRPRLALEKGDVFQTLALPQLRGVSALVVYPALAIGTAEAYGRVRPAPPAEPLAVSLARPLATWPAYVSNDFEAALTPTYPVLAEVKQRLYEAGAAYASLSGSGSAVFGLFEGEVPKLEWPAEYTVWSGGLGVNG